MKKGLTTARIGKREKADAEIASQWLTFKLWEKSGKSRVYISDYKRRTLGYIDLDNGNEVVINDHQGNMQEEIDFAVSAFFAEYIDEEVEEREEAEIPEYTRGMLDHDYQEEAYNYVAAGMVDEDIKADARECLKEYKLEDDAIVIDYIDRLMEAVEKEREGQK